MRSPILMFAALISIVATACQDATQPVAPEIPVSFAAGPKTAVTANGQGVGTLIDSVGPRGRYRIEYHNGPEFVSYTPAVYFIWYGNWVGFEPYTKTILTDLASNIGSSPYLRIATLYHDANNNAPTGGMIYAGAVDDLYSHGPSLTRADVADIVHNQIAQGALPLDTYGLYIVLATHDVAVDDLAQRTCAYHEATTYNGSGVRHAYIGSPVRMAGVCLPQQTGPNDSRNADAMASLLAAEMANIVTDPTFAGWYDRLGYEMADKCAWTYGTTYAAANGARANVRLGQRDFLLQQLWVPSKSGGRCALAL